MTNKNSLDHVLLALEKEQLILLIHELLDKSNDCRKILLKWMELSHIPIPDTEEITGNDSLLDEYWAQAEEIISLFNESNKPPLAD